MIHRNIITWEYLQLNCLNQEIRYHDRILRLTPKEYGLLELLLSNPQRVFSRSALISKLWELEAIPTESVITSHIKSIRQKLKAAGATEDPIETLYGFGYRLRRLEQIALIDGASSKINSSTVNEIDLALWELWQKFRGSFDEQIDFLSTTARSLTKSPKQKKKLTSARQIAHKLVGSLGVYGFSEGSSLARQIFDLFNPQTKLTINDLQQLEHLIHRLRLEVDREPTFAATAIPVVSPEIEQEQTQARLPLVMVVDDDAAILQQLSILLSPWGLEVIPVVDRHCFWELLNSITPDLLILDIEMPEVNGIELCQTVRDDRQWGNLPILFITAAQDPNSIVQAFAAGGDDYIRKPILEPELVARVLNQLEPRRHLMSKLLAKSHD